MSSRVFFLNYFYFCYFYVIFWFFFSEFCLFYFNLLIFYYQELCKIWSLFLSWKCISSRFYSQSFFFMKISKNWLTVLFGYVPLVCLNYRSLVKSMCFFFFCLPHNVFYCIILGEIFTSLMYIMHWDDVRKKDIRKGKSALILRWGCF